MPLPNGVPIIEEFREILDFSKHVSVPGDWFVVISDVKGSTRAIEAGHYKDVNVIGAASIIAALNSAGREDIPYIFGGDGATFLVPPQSKDKVCQALQATRRMARNAFELDLRIGVVPALELYSKGFQIKMAKHRISEFFTQTVLSGNGIAAAENLVKDPNPGNRYLLGEEKTENPGGDFTGLECRWLPVENKNGETVSLIVMSVLQDPDAGQKCYREVLQQIEEIYGHKEGYRPISENRLNLAGKVADYLAESKVRSYPGGLWSLGRYLFVTYFMTMAVRWAWKWLGLPFGKRYKNELVANSDYRKFDGALRMVLDGNAAQREKLQEFLEQKFQQNDLVYGIQKSDHALLTCLIFERSLGKHLHLVDGGDGGYARAAKNMKDRLKEKRPSPGAPPKGFG